MKILKRILLTGIVLAVISGAAAGLHVWKDMKERKTSYMEKYYGSENGKQTKQEEPQVPSVADIVLPDSAPFSEHRISFGEQEAAAFIREIKSYFVTYEGSGFFHVREALDKYDSLEEYNPDYTFQYIIDNKINEAALYERILENNRDYLAKISGKRYAAYEADYFTFVWEALINTINTQLARGENIDVRQLDENLSNLKILNADEKNYGFVTDDADILSVNQRAVLAKGDKDFFYAVACHEANHFIQAASRTETEKEGYKRNTGVYYEWEDLSVNPLAYQWYVEGSAERLSLSENNIPKDLIVYAENVKSIDSLTLAVIMRADADELTVPRLSLQPDLNRLFTVFHCDTESDREEFVKMMFSFEILYNKDKAFYAESGISDHTFEYDLWAAAAQTLTKTFYCNLSERLSRTEENLSDIFSLIALFEADLNRLTKYYDTSRHEKNRAFLEMYSCIQESFFENIAKAAGLSAEEVASMYEDYYEHTGNLSEESCFEQNERRYFEEMYASRATIRPKKNLAYYRNN